MNWTKFGWAGIVTELPEEWEISGLSGDQKEGYLRLEDEFMPRLELKWSVAKSKRRNPDLHAVLDDYFKIIRKTYKKTKKDLHIKRNVSLIKDTDFLDGYDLVFFTWKGEIQANGLIFFCPETRRITLIQVMGKPKQNVRTITEQIFTSVEIEPNNQKFLWTAYNLHVEVPKDYRLEKHQLLSGYLLFSFINPGSLTDRKRRLSIERYGLADILLKDQTLEDWFRTKYKKAIRGFGFQIESRDQDEAEYLILNGEETRVTDNIPIHSVQLANQIKKRKRFIAHIRHCYKSNRIYVIQVVSKTDAIETAESVADSIALYN